MCGNYSREETIQGRKLYREIRYLLESIKNLDFRLGIQTKVQLDTQNMTNPTIVCLVKMEYRWNFSISGLKMMVKSGLEFFFLKFLHLQAIFYLHFLLENK
jgi:hypothetical protein